MIEADCPFCDADIRGDDEMTTRWAWTMHQLGAHPEQLADHFDQPIAEISAMADLAGEITPGPGVPANRLALVRDLLDTGVVGVGDVAALLRCP